MSLTIRPGTPDDVENIYHVFRLSVMDIGHRHGFMPLTEGADPDALEQLWERRKPMLEHLARTAEQFWIAEDKGRAVGYARAIQRDGVRELTEFFVLPESQSSGVGHELLDRAFPRYGARRRCIIASTDVRGLALYMRTGVYPTFPSSYFSRPAERVDMPTDLIVEPIGPSAYALSTIAMIDQAVLGYRRDVDHTWLLTNRRGFLFLRAGIPVGYGYVGVTSAGPVALLAPRDFPAVLAHLERQVADGGGDFGVEVPMVNRTAIEYLLSRGFRVSQMVSLWMCDEAFGRFQNYIFTSPPFFM